MEKVSKHVVTVEQNGKQVEKITYDSPMVVVIGREQSSIIAHEVRITDYIDIILRIDSLRNGLIERLAKHLEVPKDEVLKLISELGDTVDCITFEKKL